MKGIAQECLECQPERDKPAGQIMGGLPDVRLDILASRTNRTAVDEFGPFQVGLGSNQTAQRYRIIFTCLVTRAVFLVLAN